MATLADLIIRVRLDGTGQVVAGVTGVERKFESLDKKLNRIGGKLRSVGQTMSTFVSAPLIALGVATTNAASDLNESINAIRVTFGPASRAIEQFGKTSAQSVGLSRRAFNELVTPIGAMLRNYGLSADEAALQTIALTQRAADMASVFNTDVSEAMTAIQAALRGEADPIERFGVNMSAAAVEAEAMALGINKSWNEMTSQEKTLARLSLFFKQTDRVAGDFRRTSDEVANAERIARAEAENQAAAFGQKLIPVKRRLIETAGRLLERFNRLSPGMQDLILKAGMIAVAIGPVMTAIGGITQGIGGLTTALTFLAAHPIVALVAVVAAAAAAMWIWRDRIRELSAPLRVVIGVLLMMVSPILGVVWAAIAFRDQIVAAFRWVRDTAINIGNALVSAFRSTRDGIVTAFSAVANFFRTVWNGILGAVRAVVSWFTGTFVPFWVSVWQTVRGPLQMFWRVVYTIFQVLVVYVFAQVIAIAAFIISHWDKIRAVTTAIWTFILTSIRIVWAGIVAYIRFNLNVARTIITAAWNMLRALTMSAWNLIGAIIRGVWNYIIMPVWRAMVAFVRNVIVPGFLYLLAGARIVWNGIAAAIRFVWTVFIRPIWQAILAFIFRVLVPGFLAMRHQIVSAWNRVRDGIGAAWSFIRDRILGPVGRWIERNVVDRFRAMRDTLGRIWEQVRRTASEVWDRIVRAVRNPINSIINFINSLINGINRVLDMIPGINIQIPRIPQLGGGGSSRRAVRSGRHEHQAFREKGGPVPIGSGFTTDGPTVVVGEGNPRYPEAVIATDPKYRSRNMRLLAWAAQRMGVPGFALGGIIDSVGDAFSAGRRWIGDRIRDAGGFLSDLARSALVQIFRPVNNAVKAGLNRVPNVLHLRDAAQGVRETIWQWVKGADEGLPEISSRPIPGRSGVERWRNVALAALRAAGESPHWINDLLTQMAHESGGNPNAINRWDINARRGIPSQGLMQVIPPTFARFAGPYRNRGILDPFANIYAAIKYTKATYGTLGAWRARGFRGYLNGGFVKPPGGIVHPGELVLNRAQQTRLLQAVDGKRSRTIEVHVEPGAIVINPRSGPEAEEDGRAAAKGFLDEIVERSVLVNSRL